MKYGIIQQHYSLFISTLIIISYSQTDIAVVYRCVCVQ